MLNYNCDLFLILHPHNLRCGLFHTLTTTISDPNINLLGGLYFLMFHNLTNKIF